jgi:hypothetical protein
MEVGFDGNLTNAVGNDTEHCSNTYPRDQVGVCSVWV